MKRKSRVTIAKKEKGKGYTVNVGGRKKFDTRTKAMATKKAKLLRKKRSKK